MSPNASIEPLSPWKIALSGSAAAVLANAIVYPLDIAKTRIQVQVKQENPSDSRDSSSTGEHYTSTFDVIQKLFEAEGIHGLYAGLNSSLIGVASTNFVYFYWYSAVRGLYLSSRKIDKPPNTAIELSLGAIAGAIAQVFTIPVSVITTRQQTQSSREKVGLIETGREIVAGDDGWTGLWRGLKASLVLVINPAITYGAYERLRLMFFRERTNLKSWESFVLGASAKALATVVSQPLIVAKVSLQSRPPASRNGKPFATFSEVLRYIIAQEGPTALFKGLGPQITKGVLVQGLLMMIKDRVEILFRLIFIYVRHFRSRKTQANVIAAVQTAAKTVHQKSLVKIVKMSG